MAGVGIGGILREVATTFSSDSSNRTIQVKDKHNSGTTTFLHSRVSPYIHQSSANIELDFVICVEC